MKAKKLINIILVLWGIAITFILVINVFITGHLLVDKMASDGLAWEYHRKGHEDLGTTCTADSESIAIIKATGNAHWLKPECAEAEGR